MYFCQFNEYYDYNAANSISPAIYGLMFMFNFYAQCVIYNLLNSMIMLLQIVLALLLMD